MQAKSKKFALALAVGAAAPYLARADMELDRDDVPQACQSICEPIVQLTNTCDPADDRIRGGDQVEDLLRLQCVCTNSSFNVARISALCQSCMSQNSRGRDTMDDINEIVRRCGFTTQSYVSASDSGAAATVSVQATRPTDASQLTTTFQPGGPSQTSASTTRSGSIAITSGTNVSVTRSNPTGTSSGTAATGGSQTTVSTSTPGSAAAALLSSPTGVYYAAGALVAAAMFLQ